MTPTSDERREVAERLRENAGKRGVVLDYLGSTQVASWWLLLHTIGCDSNEQEYAFRMLADLIDPTCEVKLKRVVVDEHYRDTRFIPTCSVCGSPLDGGIGIPRFCPGCGARRVPRKVTHRCK